MNYVREGNPDATIVFVALHGGPGSHKDFKYLPASLEQNLPPDSFELIRFDLPGYGHSDKMPMSPTSTNFGTSVIEALEKMTASNRSKKFIFVGHR